LDSTLAARHCLAKGLTKVFIVGEPGLVRTMQQLGVEVVNDEGEGLIGTGGDSAQAIVSGICREAFSYKLLNAAMQVAIRTQTYIACNKDLTYPIENGRFCPGSGAIVAAIEACSGIKSIVVGKPEPAILLDALAHLGIDPKKTLMVGDRMDTDIECGKAAGGDTCLVLSGVTQKAVENQWCIDSVKDLV
jgi:4-nitrophenyl phosphatase